MSAVSDEVKAVAAAAVADEVKLADLAGLLGESSRSKRQKAAAALGQVAATNPDLLAPHVNAIIDALSRPEAQTRWECLEILAKLVPLEARTCEKALPGAETALFDEESGFVRLAAMRFLCAWGKTTENRSERCWPLIDEGIQCYHGDIEFNDMIAAVTDFAGGKLSAHVKEALVARMTFDATSGKGPIRRKAQAIIDVVEGK